MTKQTAEEIAYELSEVRRVKNELIKTDKLLTDELKKRIKEGESQNYYKIRTDFALDIIDESLAIAWAIEHECTRVDVPAVDQWVKNHRHAIPQGFSLVEKEKLVEVKE